MNIHDILQLLENVKRQGNGYTARCPAHDDRHNSLSVGVGEDERLLLHCHAGCSLQQIVKARGLSISDLFPQKAERHTDQERIVATYDYTDENGVLLFQCVRFESKEFRQRQPDGLRGWVWNLYGVRRVLYRLPDVLRAVQQKMRIYIVEGEKDVENLRKLGLTATTNPMGAGKWSDDSNPALSGADCILLPDNDETGQKHMNEVACSLQKVGASIRIVNLPNLPPKGDVSDWTEAGGTVEALEQLADNAPAWKPSQSDGRNGKNEINPDDETFNPFNSFFPSPALNNTPEIPVLDPVAYYGLAGDFLHLVEPHTEADPAALLIQFLALFGCLIGRAPYFGVEGTRHYPNLFTVIVGQSAKARKGTSWGQVRRLFEQGEQDFTDTRVHGGLSSGEGLIHAVRDPVEKQAPIKDKGIITGYQSVIEDEGESDKRLFVIEEEFGRTLRAMQREGSTLSAVLRQAWDNGSLRVMTKTPLRATNAHISIVAHITQEELQRLLSECDSVNGFGNRFLWVFARRSKFLPEGGSLRDIDLLPLVRQIHDALTFAQSAGEMVRDNEARELWCAAYPELTAETYGLVGSLTSRADAQVLRLSMIYALLDRSAVIRRVHLEAALAVWRYSEATVRHIFGNHSGDPLAEQIAKLLQRKGATGATRTDINRECGGNYSKERLTAALDVLQKAGRAYRTTESSGDRGRPAEHWIIQTVSDGINGTNGINQRQGEPPPVQRTAPPDQIAAAEAAAHARQHGHDHCRRPEEDAGSDEENYSRDYFGALGELLAQSYLLENDIRFVAAPDVADRPPDGADLTLLPSGRIVDVKSPRPNAPGLSVNCDTLAKSGADFVLPVRFLNDKTAVFYHPIHSTKIKAAEVRTGSNGSLYYFLPWELLTPLTGPDSLRALSIEKV